MSTAQAESDDLKRSISFVGSQQLEQLINKQDNSNANFDSSDLAPKSGKSKGNEIGFQAEPELNLLESVSNSKHKIEQNGDMLQQLNMTKLQAKESVRALKLIII